VSRVRADATRRWTMGWARSVLRAVLGRIKEWFRQARSLLRAALGRIKEWFRQAYHAHCIGSPRPGVSSARAWVEGVVATAAVECMERAYRRAVERVLRHPAVPLCAPPTFRSRSILFAAGSLGPGGSERQVVTTLAGLARAGYTDLSLLCFSLSDRGSDFYRPLLDGTPVTCAELRAAGSPRPIDALRCPDAVADDARERMRAVLRPLPGELRDVERIALDLLERRPGIVHAWLDDVNVKAGLAAAIVGVPRIVLNVRSVAPPNFLLFQPYMRPIYQALASLPALSFLSNSTAGARSYAAWLGIDERRFRVVRNGLDCARLPHGAERDAVRAEYRASRGIPEHVLVVGTVMRFSEEKRPLLWLQTAAEVARRVPEAVFLMVGDGPLREAVRERAEEAGLGRRLVLCGQEDRPAHAMAAMDVFLLSSRLEGLPNVLIEAQAMGIPVVTTDVGGARETLCPGTTGHAVAAETAGALADAVVDVLRDPAFRERVRIAAPQFVRQAFDVQRLIHETVAAYET